MPLTVVVWEARSQKGAPLVAGQHGWFRQTPEQIPHALQAWSQHSVVTGGLRTTYRFGPD